MVFPQRRNEIEIKMASDKTKDLFLFRNGFLSFRQSPGKSLVERN